MESEEELSELVIRLGDEKKAQKKGTKQQHHGVREEKRGERLGLGSGRGKGKRCFSQGSFGAGVKVPEVIYQMENNKRIG